MAIEAFHSDIILPQKVFMFIESAEKKRFCKNKLKRLHKGKASASETRTVKYDGFDVKENIQLAKMKNLKPKRINEYG